MSSSAPLCVVCGSGRKYKCPTCNAHYCSVGCFSIHKTTCAAPVIDSATKAPSHVPSETTPSEEEGVTLSSADLRAIETDLELRKSLRDPALQRALLAIDSAPDRPKALSEAMARDPRLHDFLDHMLLSMGKAQRGPGGAFEFIG